MSSPTATATVTAATTSFSASPPAFSDYERLTHIDSNDPKKRPLEPLTTIIMLGAIGLRQEPSRFGYRSNYAQCHIIRHPDKPPVGENIDGSVGGFFRAGCALASRVYVGTVRSLQGASHEDIPNLAQAVENYVLRYDLRNPIFQFLLQSALVGISKISASYRDELRPHTDLEEISRIAQKALSGTLPRPRPSLHCEWREDELQHFYGKLRSAYDVMRDLDKLTIPFGERYANQQKQAMGAQLQQNIEDSLDIKAKAYEELVNGILRSQTQGVLAQSALIAGGGGAIGSPSLVNASQQQQQQQSTANVTAATATHQ